MEPKKGALHTWIGTLSPILGALIGGILTYRAATTAAVITSTATYQAAVQSRDTQISDLERVVREIREERNQLQSQLNRLRTDIPRADSSAQPQAPKPRESKGSVLSENNKGTPFTRGARLKLWIINDVEHARFLTDAEPIASIEDAADGFDVAKIRGKKQFALAQRVPIAMQWSGVLNLDKTGEYVFVAGLKLSSAFKNHGYGYHLFHTLTIDDQKILEAEAKDITTKSDPAVRTASKSLNAGRHRVSILLSVRWRKFPLYAPYALDPSAAMVDLQWKRPGDGTLDQLSPKDFFME